MKPEDVKIISLTHDGAQTIGLGDDMKLYHWLSIDDGNWYKHF